MRWEDTHGVAFQNIPRDEVVDALLSRELRKFLAVCHEVAPDTSDCGQDAKTLVLLLE